MSSTKKIEDYLHYYMGCECVVKCNDGINISQRGKIVEVTRGSNHGDWVVVLFPHVVEVMRFSRNASEVSSNMHHFFFSEDSIKPILRQLSDMTEEEMNHIAIKLKAGTANVPMLKWKHNSPFTSFRLTPEIIHYLLSKGFDLFGLCEAGLAIDTKTVQK